MTDLERAAMQQQNAEMKAAVEQMEAKLRVLTADRSTEDRDALASAQSRMDSVASMFGERAPAPQPGETPRSYRRRMMGRLQRHSPAFKDVELARADDGLLDLIETRVYNDAAESGRGGGALPALAMIPYQETDPAGRKVTKFYGDPLAWMAAYMGTGTIGRIIRPGREP